MAALSALYPHILPAVRGCDTDTVDFHVRQAAIEFCRRSQVWRAELQITPVAGTETYAIPLPADVSASMLLEFSALDANGNRNDRFHMVNPGRGRALQRDNSYSSYVYLSDDGLSISVEPIPDVSDAMLVPYFSLKPTQAAATLPDFIVEQYADTLAAGALARLLDMPKTAWRDPSESAGQRVKFLADCGAASVRASRGNARSKTRARGCFY